MIESTQYDSFDLLNKIRKIEGNKYYCPEQLTQDELKKLQKLNDRLTTYETSIAIELKKQIKIAKRRVDNKSSLITGFNCTLNVEFYINKSNKYYINSTNNENIIMALEDSYCKLDWGWGIDDKNCHNDMAGRENHPMKDETHCYIYHGLYDHTDLHWNEILQIDYIGFTITTKLEYTNDNETF